MEKSDLLFLIKTLDKKLRDDFTERLMDNGLTAQEGHVLFFISCKTKYHHVEVHQNDIENEFKLSKSTVSDLVKRMERKQLIIKTVKKPYANLTLTETAINKIEAVRNKRTETIEKLFKGFTEEDKDQVLNLVKRLINNMEGNYEGKN